MYCPLNTALHVYRVTCKMMRQSYFVVSLWHPLKPVHGPIPTACHDPRTVTVSPMEHPPKNGESQNIIY